ncbi:MAG: hypothetical protein C4519_17185 [Desulfobacteraceae bacterium]|nr:MAG: hypothetical protein C4519_17185 [Desulfobacteraceae bacterium]
MPTPNQIFETIQRVRDEESFIQELLIRSLCWQIDDRTRSLEEITFGWSEDELRAQGLAERITEGTVHQIQPMGNNPWGIFILNFTNPEVFVTGRGMTGVLRAVLRGLVPSKRRNSSLPSFDRENLLFICTYQYRHFHFAYFKTPQNATQRPPLASFGWMAGDTHIRTLCAHNLPNLTWRYDITPEEWVNAWAEAFKIEKVTKKFYDEYDQVFKDAERVIRGQATWANVEDLRMYTQTLFNRLLFLRFIERKGWLEFQGNKDYLRALFSAGGINDESLFRSRIHPLFFEGLAIEGRQASEAIGRVQFLNGGLFEENPLDRAVTDLPDQLFRPIIGPDGLFYRYNFTVEESTPWDIEVAVDPEMLGKVFEKLVTKRKEQGSYYTPRTVVSFMCREALKGYLGGFSELVEKSDTSRITLPQARELLDKIRRIKVCDPACGSGAYLIGMMHELHAIIGALENRTEPIGPRDDYRRKLEIINNNLYGVDIDLFATNIARLRLWLSLAVDYPNDDPPALPNLDFKIETEDSLTAPNPTELLVQLDLTFQPRVEEYARLKTEYAAERDCARKDALRRDIGELRTYLKNELHRGARINGFDWAVEFAEVFFPPGSTTIGGFDVVIANPPYGLPVPDSLRDMYFPNLRGEIKQNTDSYGIFMARALQLLKEGGFFTFITSDTWRTILTFRPLRIKISGNATILHFLDLPPWIFDATVNTCILSLLRSPAPTGHKVIAGDLHNLPQDNWELLEANLNAVAAHGPDLQTLTFARYSYRQNIIPQYENFSFFIGLPALYFLLNSPSYLKLGSISDVPQGISTGQNKYYIRRVSAGEGYDAVDTTKILSQAEIASFTEDEKLNGVDPNRYGGRTFIPFDKGGAAETDDGWLPNYWVPTEYYISWSRESVERMRTLTIAQRKRLEGLAQTIKPGDDRKIAAALRNPDAWFKPAISFSPTGFYSPTFRIGSNSMFGNKGSFIICQSVRIEILLGFLTAVFTKYILKTFISHTIETGEEVIRQVIIPRDISDMENEIAALTTAIMERQKEDPRYAYHDHEQQIINSLIFRKYATSADEIREIELWYCRRYPRLATAQGFMTEVQEKYADHLARCERIMSMPPGYWNSHPVLRLIAKGESSQLEFKETLKFDISTGQNNSELAKAALKTIAAMLNTSGGTLLIGISDAGEIKGVARDLQFCRHQNLDGFELTLRDLLRDRLTPQPLEGVEIHFEHLPEGDVCQIDVSRSSQVIYLDREVYVRDGNRSIKLEGPALVNWVRQRNGTQ